MTKYWTSDEIRKKKAVYNIIYGKRSAGKSFDMFLHAVTEYWTARQRGEIVQWAYLRRTDVQLKSIGTRTAHECLLTDGEGKNRVEEITGGVYNSITYYRREWYLSKYDEKLDQTVKDIAPFMMAFSLNNTMNDKGGQYPHVRNIWFEEFMEPASSGYLSGEFSLLMHTISTIARNRDDITIWFTGNSIDRFCPYFDDLGLTRAREQAAGTIDVYKLGKTGKKIAVEYTKPGAASTSSNSFLFQFDKPELQMIYEGGWEISAYPILSDDLNRRDIAGRFFIYYHDIKMEGDIICRPGEEFVYIHRSIDPLDPPDEDLDLIYSPQPSGKKNYRRRINYRFSEGENRLYNLIRGERIFFDDNMTGDTFDSYMKWCKQGGY